MTSPIGLNIEEELGCLLRVNYDVVQALVGKKPEDQRLQYSEGLALKLFGHAITALHLTRNRTNIRPPCFDFDVNFVDWASIQVLARASTEVVLAFDYVFRNPVGEDEAEFRYFAWMLAGFVKRESFPVQTAEGKQQIAKDAKMNAQMRGRIQKSIAFQALTKGQQKGVLEGRDWHPGKTLSAMCEDVFGKTWGRPLYSFMSSHAHADALSSVQIKQTGDNALRLARYPLLTIAFAVARMSESYAAMWVRARKVYKAHAYRELNESYLQFRDFHPESD